MAASPGYTAQPVPRLQGFPEVLTGSEDALDALSDAGGSHDR